MLDSLSLDQLRVFIAAADAGSFSAAARRLRRAQSLVSDMISRLEGDIGVRLFDRSARYPKLTPHGRVLLADARAIIADVDYMRARGKGMASGIEPELCVVVDVMFPVAAITAAALQFRKQFPATPLRLFVEVLGNCFAPLLEGRASFGIVGPPPAGLDLLSTERLGTVPMVMVAAREHPLAKLRRRIARSELAHHTQLVLTDRSSLSSGRDYYVLSSSTWRLADLFVKREFLLAGLGWGGMPRHTVQQELTNGQLVALDLEDFPSVGLDRPALAAYVTAAPPGPAGRWLIEWLKERQ